MLSEVEKQLCGIVRSYSEFLAENRLLNTRMTRLIYFSAIKNAYLQNPLADQETQIGLITSLDTSMENSQREILVASQRARNSMVTYFSEKYTHR